MGYNYSKMAKKAKLEKFKNNKGYTLDEMKFCNFFMTFGTIGTSIYRDGQYLLSKGHKGYSKAKFSCNM